MADSTRNWTLHSHSLDNVVVKNDHIVSSEIGFESLNLWAWNQTICQFQPDCPIYPSDHFEALISKTQKYSWCLLQNNNLIVECSKSTFYTTSTFVHGSISPFLNTVEIFTTIFFHPHQFSQQDISIILPTPRVLPSICSSKIVYHIPILSSTRI